MASVARKRGGLEMDTLVGLQSIRYQAARPDASGGVSGSSTMKSLIVSALSMPVPADSTCGRHRPVAHLDAFVRPKLQFPRPGRLDRLGAGVAGAKCLEPARALQAAGVFLHIEFQSCAARLHPTRRRADHDRVSFGLDAARLEVRHSATAASRRRRSRRWDAPLGLEEDR